MTLGDGAARYRLRLYVTQSRREQRVQAIGRQSHRPDGASVHYERNRSEQTTPYRLAQQRAQTSFAQAEAATGTSLLQFVKGEFDTFLDCGIPAHGFASKARPLNAATSHAIRDQSTGGRLRPRYREERSRVFVRWTRFDVSLRPVAKAYSLCTANAEPWPA